MVSADQRDLGGNHNATSNFVRSYRRFAAEWISPAQVESAGGYGATDGAGNRYWYNPAAPGLAFPLNGIMAPNFTPAGAPEALLRHLLLQVHKPQGSRLHCFSGLRTEFHQVEVPPIQSSAPVRNRCPSHTWSYRTSERHTACAKSGSYLPHSSVNAP